MASYSTLLYLGNFIIVNSIEIMQYSVPRLCHLVEALLYCCSISLQFSITAVLAYGDKIA